MRLWSEVIKYGVINTPKTRLMISSAIFWKTIKLYMSLMLHHLGQMNKNTPLIN